MFRNRASDARRSSLQIFSDILDFCLIPQPKTRILHDTNTNFKLLEKYLMKLQSARLIAKRRGSYMTTAKGADFVESWTRLQKMLRRESTSEIVRTRKRTVNSKQLLFVVE